MDFASILNVINFGGSFLYLYQRPVQQSEKLPKLPISATQILASSHSVEQASDVIYINVDVLFIGCYDC